MQHLKEENGYITQCEICFRLKDFDLPKGEAFFMRKKNSLFSTVGWTFKDTDLTFFDVYTPDEFHYDYIRGLLSRVLRKIGPLEAGEWSEDESQGSTNIVEVSGGVGGGGSSSGSAVAKQH